MARFEMMVVIVVEGDDQEVALQTIQNAIDFVGQGPVKLLESRDVTTGEVE